MEGGKGAGGVREAGEEGAGSERKRENLRNVVQYFAIEKMQRGTQQIQKGLDGVYCVMGHMFCTVKRYTARIFTVNCYI